MAVDGSGNVVVTGYSRNPTNDDCYTAKYATMDGTLLWEKYYVGAGNGLDRFYAVAIDLSDNVVVTGNSWSGSNDDCHTVKYAAADGALLWEAVYNPENGFDRGLTVVVDSSGDVIVAGQSSTNGGSGCYTAKHAGADGTLLWDQRFTAGSGVPRGVAIGITGNVFVLSDEYSPSGAEYVTFAYSSSGTPLWTNRYHGAASSTDTPSSVAVDDAGNVVVTGHSSGSGSSSDLATIAYSNAGVPLWTNRYNGPANGADLYPRMAVDAGGNIIVTGDSSGGGSSFDYATIKYSSTGLPLWTNRYDGPGYYQASASALVVDGNGNAFVTGISLNNSYATIAYTSAGVPLWTNGYAPGSSLVAAPNSLALDQNGDVIVAGGSGYRTIKYSNSGVPLWTNRYNGVLDTGSDSAKAVAVDGSGNVFVTGRAIGSGLNSDFTTIAYTSAGVPIWTNRYDGPGSSGDSAEAVVVDANGNVIVTGSSIGAGGNLDYATIAYSGTGVLLWIKRYNGPANGNDSPRGKQSLALGPAGSVYVTGNSASDRGGATDFATVKYMIAPQPTLAIQMVSTGAVRICWPTNAANGVIESLEALSTNVVWVPVNALFGIEGSDFCFTNTTANDDARFFRLRLDN
jgi:outer membrane protein assembly factor BamB